MHSQNPSSKKSLLLHHLPAEILEEILSRLPVKSLLRFKCVSKSWLSLIESNRFIKIHFQNSSKNTSLSHHRVVFNGMSGCSVLSLLNSNSKEGPSSSYISISILDPTYKNGLIVGCCSGVLLCLLSTDSDDKCFSMWNPATRVYAELPKLSGSVYPKCGFGWDESSGAFKVFATTLGDSCEISGNVYSSKTNSWKTVPRGSVNYLFNYFGVFVCGRIHWTMMEFNHDAMNRFMKGFVDDAIESFNLETDEFGRIEPPPPSNADATEGGSPRLWLGEIGGCLCTLSNYKKSSEVWVMKEYGVKDSWFKLLTFPIDHASFSLSRGFPPLVGEGLNGDIFIICRDTFMIYSLEDDQVLSKVANFDRSNGAFVYIESLVSPLKVLGGKRCLSLITTL